MTERHLLWRRGVYSISLAAESYGSPSISPTHWVSGMVDNTGAFGIHFADARAIHVTHLLTGQRAHPEPGFRSIGAAIKYAETIVQLSDHWDTARPLDVDAMERCRQAYITCMFEERRVGS